MAVLVVAAAGVTGTAHFAGARWLPHWKISRRSPTPRTAPTMSLPLAPRTTTTKSTGNFALGSVLPWILVGIVVVGVAVLIWRWWTSRPSRAAAGWRPVAASGTAEVTSQPEPEPEVLVPALRTGIWLALEVLDEQRDPADAVVRAWLGLEETARESGIVRQPAETPTEFTSRILGRAFGDDRAIRTLLRLYLRTRFGDHPVTSDDVAAVRVALQELVQTWPTSAVTTGAGSRHGSP